jgi:hypothetical protein
MTILMLSSGWYDNILHLLDANMDVIIWPDDNNIIWMITFIFLRTPHTGSMARSSGYGKQSLHQISARNIRIRLL